jgi:phospholipase/carboxylesterase
MALRLGTRDAMLTMATSREVLNRQGRMSVRVRSATMAIAEAKPIQQLALASRALLLTPKTYEPERPLPLLVMLHGANGRPDRALSLVAAQARQDGFFVLAPKSQAASWDIIRGGFGPDVGAIEEALDWIFDRYAIEPSLVAIGGFSDGASYALSLGLANGDLFGDVLAFSPGFAAPSTTVGQPRIYISHGRDDQVLPFVRCGAALAQALGEAGYDVRFDPFDEGHVVRPGNIQAAADRWLGKARIG